MPTLKKPADLAAVLGQVMDTDNPLEALRIRGFSFSTALQKKLSAAPPPKILSPQERARWVQKSKQVGSVRFGVRKVALAAPSLPAGEYDFICSLRLGMVNQALTALYAAFTWPHEITPDDAGQLFKLDELRSFADGIPAGANIQVGALNFSAPPTVSPVSGTDHLILHQTFSLDIDQVTFRPNINLGSLGSQRTRVTSLDGVLSIGVVVFADFETPDRLRFVFNGVSVNAGHPQALHITVSPGSPLQPRNPQALTILERNTHNRFNFAVVAGKIEQSYSISPEVRLPIGGGVPIRLQRVDVRSVSAGNEGVLVVGVLLGPTATPDAGAGDPARLKDPFNTDAANVYTRVHEELLRKIVRQALDNNVLQQQASAQRDDLKIEGADIELKTNEIRLILKARLVDACSFNKDLSFTATKIFRYSVFGGEITVTEEQDVDLDNSDVFLCVVLGLLEGLIVAAAFSIIGFIVDLIAQIVHFVNLTPGAGGDDDPTRLDAVFQTDLPVPGSEVLPQAETLQSRVEERFMEANGVASLIPDEVNTYVYVAFQRRSEITKFPVQIQPIANARIELVDQDSPRPGGDDIAIPDSRVTTKFGQNRIQTTITSFEPPRSDQVLARKTSASSGQVRFVLKPDELRTTAGTLTTRIIIEDTDKGILSDKKTTEIIRENRPDVYLRVTQVDGKKFDTRSMTGGFTLNLRSKRIGSAGAPLVFTLVTPTVAAPVTGD